MDRARSSLDIIGTPDIEGAAKKVHDLIPSALAAPHDAPAGSDARAAVTQLARAQMEFIQITRKHFGRPPKVFTATPMIERWIQALGRFLQREDGLLRLEEVDEHGFSRMMKSAS
jgi:hypothetical protein